MDPKSFHSIGLAPVVQKLDEDIHWMNLFPLDNAIGFCNTYLLDSDFLVESSIWTNQAWTWEWRKL